MRRRHARLARIGATLLILALGPPLGAGVLLAAWPHTGAALAPLRRLARAAGMACSAALLSRLYTLEAWDWTLCHDEGAWCAVDIAARRPGRAAVGGVTCGP